jgi:inner membrane transporter RhtA
VVSLLWLVVAMASFQVGAALAKSLFPVVGARGAAALRLSIAAVILLVAYRAWRARLPAAAWWQVLRYGAVLGLMNLSFYLALEHLPLGITVAIEFTGPLCVALWHSRRALDLLWIALAVLGLALLLPLHGGAARVDPVGIVFALGAALFWGLYIVWGKPAGVAAGQWTVPIGMAIGALAVSPIGAGPALQLATAPALLWIALAVALLSNAIPYSIEMRVLMRLPARVFGVSMSLEPALAALAGWLLLGERLALLQYVAIAAIVVASAGAALATHSD